MKRLSWSKLFNLTALVSLGIVTSVASAQSPSIQVQEPGSRTPVITQPVGARVPAVSPGTSLFKAWEGFTTTNFLNTEQYLYTPSLASTAAGPTNIITIVNRRIAIYDNPNAVIAATSNQAGGTTQRVVASPTAYTPTSEALLDAMLGEAVLRNICPTGFGGGGFGGSTISCLVDNASVRYDQMQGRFLIGMTVTDTGVETIGNFVTKPRKATWVLMMSKFSVFPSQGTLGSSDIFITPTPPSGSTSGLNTNNWSVYYGNAQNALGSDGFGALPTALAATNFGNLNGIPGILTTTAAQDAIFDCTPGAMQATGGAAPSKVCYFPTSLRIGIDNDNVILTASVVNVNYNLPPAGTAAPIPAFAGTRVRVVKKGGGAPGSGNAAGLYQKGLGQSASAGTPGLTPGNQFLAGAAAAAGDYYDMYAMTNTATGAPLLVGNFTAAAAYAPYTVAPNTANTNLAPVQGVFCEPARVRGRPAASYTNAMVPPGPTSQNYLECIVSTPFGVPLAGTQNTIYVQPILYNVVNVAGSPFNAPSNTNLTTPFFPTLVGDGTTTGVAAAGTGMQAAVVQAFTNPSTVAQANYLGTAPGPGGAAPVMNVGDDRPQEIVFREGHLYDARVANIVGGFKTDGTALSATIAYDILQKLQAGAAGTAVNPVLGANWTNTDTWAPQYEVPANVSTQGQTPPINLFPWLEKLFGSTTFPALSSSDPRVAVQGAGAVNCQANNIVPNIIGGIVTSTRAFLGLYDQHCGLDVYDTFQPFRDPVTGQIVTTLPFTNNLPAVSAPLRGGASTDPNNGSLWNFGLYANRRFGTISGTGQLGSYISNYDLAFPTTDPYGNTTGTFTDCASAATCGFFVPVQIAFQQGLVAPEAGTGNVGVGGLNAFVTRGEMARLTILSLMDEKAIQAYLNATGGCTTSFADVASDCAGGAPTPAVGLAPNPAGSNWRYIETMRRKRITTGCFANDAIANFCPTFLLTRGQMAVFLIRAKMSNVFPSVISGCPTPQTPGCPGVVGGDNFGLSISATPYFTDEPATDPFFLYIQKMYELRITNGVNPIPGPPAYSPLANLTRGQLLTFLVRAFFY